MPVLATKNDIRRRLRCDPFWSAYALGDLDEHRFAHSRWFGLPEDTALGLLYCEFAQPVFFYQGSPRTLQHLLPEIPFEAPTQLQIRPDALAVLSSRIPISAKKAMIRMRLESHDPQHTAAEQLSSTDVAVLQALYDSGAPSGESPDFFFPSMLEEGFFFGVRQKDAVLAAAGTHIVSRSEGVAAIGNVYTHHQHRGRGFATHVTAAVVQALLLAGIQTIILNVAAHNSAAMHVYRKLGFVPHCDFFEGQTAG